MVASTNNAGTSDVKAACVMSIQSFGEQVNFKPHIHAIAADVCFTDDGIFSEAWAYDIHSLENAFVDAIFSLLQDKAIRPWISWQGGQMKILSFIEQDDVISKILRLLGLWESLEERPVANSPPVPDFVENYDGECSQLLPDEYAFEAC